LKIRIAGTAILVLAMLSTGDAHGQGVGRGAITIVTTETHAYGYSVFPDSAYWVDAVLEGSVSGLAVGDYLGAIITTDRAYMFNGVSNRWFTSSYMGVFVDCEARGATAVFWTDRAAYAIATVWASWRGVDLRPGETALGGGSTGGYAVVWTTERALAFNPSSGQWTCYELGETVLNGVVLQSVAIVWTQHGAVAFDPGLDTWIPTSVADASGASVDDQGGGDVAILWSQHEAHVFVDSADGWFAFSDPLDTIRGGSASGQVGVVWSDVKAHVFDAPRQRWSTVALEGQGRSDVPSPGVSTDRFGIYPNPLRRGSPSLHLAASAAPWSIEVIDVTGRRIRSFLISASSVRHSVAWTSVPGGPAPLAPGTYWVCARSGDRFEARRIVVLG
jgi:hypothetical protein